MEKLDQYYGLITPDSSMYYEMPRALQIYGTFKNRWCGAYWQSLGKIVIPSVSYAREDSYDFCFDGVEKGSVVAYSTYGLEDCEDDLIDGYNKMLDVIEPSAVICYGELYPKMRKHHSDQPVRQGKAHRGAGV